MELVAAPTNAQMVKVTSSMKAAGTARVASLPRAQLPMTARNQVAVSTSTGVPVSAPSSSRSASPRPSTLSWRNPAAGPHVGGEVEEGLDWQGQAEARPQG